MLKRIGKLFVIKRRWEAYVVIYALALGATTRGAQYLVSYPGVAGYLLFFACTCAVFMAGAKILDAVPADWRGRERRDPRRFDRRAHVSSGSDGAV
jgi:hypothetical protein